jgi:hypothetical protein
VFNEKKLSGLSSLQIDKVWAKLTRLDKAGFYEFLVNPSVLTWSKATTISTLSPIGTSLPTVRVQSQTKSFSLPIYLGSISNTLDMSDELAALESLANIKDDGTLPALRFEFGDWTEEYCHISNTTFSMKMMRSGKPTLVEGVLTIIPCLPFSKPTIAKEVVPVKVTKLSPREALRLAEIMRAYAKTHNGVRVNGDVVEGVSKKTGKLETLTTVNNVVRIGLGDGFNRDIAIPGKDPTP